MLAETIRISSLCMVSLTLPEEEWRKSTSSRSVCLLISFSRGMINASEKSHWQEHMCDFFMKRRGRSDEDTSFNNGRTSRVGADVNIGWFGVWEGDGAGVWDSPFGKGDAVVAVGRLLRTTLVLLLLSWLC